MDQGNVLYLFRGGDGRSTGGLHISLSVYADTHTARSPIPDKAKGALKSIIRSLYGEGKDREEEEEEWTKMRPQTTLEAFHPKIELPYSTV